MNVITGSCKHLDNHSHTQEGTGPPSHLWADTTLLRRCDVGRVLIM